MKMMKNRTVLAMCVLGASLLSMPPAAGSGETACFDEIEQHYEWDDGGFNWNSLPHCPGEQSISPLDRKWGGSAQIRASRHDGMVDAIVIEEEYAWVPPKTGTSQCPFVKTLTRTTRIAKNRVLYETVQKDDEPPKRSQRNMGPNEIIYIPNIQRVPKPGDSFLQVIGNDTIAGQPCQRVTPKQNIAGAAAFEMCIFVAPIDCPTARYLQPMELKIKLPNGQLMTHGRTTLLRYGGRGEVLPTNSIQAPK
jgi:hypothetical protein